MLTHEDRIAALEKRADAADRRSEWLLGAINKITLSLELITKLLESEQ
jgi:hypothetical protein